MGDPGRQFRDDRTVKAPPPKDDVTPIPGRDTRVGAANMTPDGVAAQQLRIATGALTQLRVVWIPALEASGGRPDPGSILNAKSALRRADDGLAQADAMRGRAKSSEVQDLFRTATAEHAALAPKVHALIDAKASVLAPSVQSQAGGGVLQVVPMNAQVSPPTPVVAATGYEPSWEDIRTAALGDAAALAKLDVSWIDSCHRLVIHGIDSEYQHSSVEGRFKATVAKDKGLRQLDADHKAQRAKVITDERAARKTANPTATKTELADKTLAADPAVIEAQNKLDAQYATDHAQQEADLRKKFDAEKHGVSHAKGTEYVAEPPKEGVTNEEGRLLARANFMAWGIHVLGSAAALKSHFLGMQEVTKLSNSKDPLLMEAKAAARLTEAATWFEQKYPGNRFFDTDVGFGLRNAHNEKHHLSYLGHALGWSIDFQAVANPSFLDHDGGIAGSVGRFMLKKYGNTDSKRAEATISLKLPSDAYAQVQKLGEAHARGEDPSVKGQAVLDAVKAYDDMTATSDRFRASQTANMADLKTAKQSWITINGPLKAELKAGKDKLDAAQKSAAKKAAKDPTIKGLTDKEAIKAAIEAFVKADTDVIAAATAVQTTETAIGKENAVVTAAMAKAFGPWVKQLEDEVKVLEVPLSDADKPLAADDKALTAVIKTITPLTTHDQLVKVLDDAKTAKYFDGAALKAIADPVALKTAMIGRLETLRSHHTKWNEAELKIRRALITKLTTGAGVFGGVAFKNGSYRVSAEVNSPPVMQLLEIGFARHDELADPTADPSVLKHPKQVFNREFIECMMRFGFAPLATSETYLDTMHFDFLEGHASTPKGDFSAGGDLGPQSKG